MQAINGQNPAVQQVASQQDDIEFVSLRKADHSDERPAVIEPSQHCKQEDKDRAFSFPSLNSGAHAHGSFHIHPSYPTPIFANANQGRLLEHLAGQPDRQTICSLPSVYDLSAFDWSPFEVFSNTPMLPRRDAENGRRAQPRHISSTLQAPASIRASHSQMTQASCSTTDPNFAFSTSSDLSERELAPRECDAGRLENIEEIIHCFWLVSENRMRQVQDELMDVSARIKGTHFEQEQIGSQLSQILPLQVQIAQKVVRAADEKKIIFGRIKSLEETSSAWQKEMKAMLETMQSELRVGLEMINDLAAVKGRKPPATKATKSEASTAAASAAAPTKNGNNKRPSPPRKKTSPASAKKTKLPSAGDRDSEAAAASFAVDLAIPPQQELPEASQALVQAQRQQQLGYDQQLQLQPQKQPYEQHQQHPQHHHPQPQIASAWPREYHFHSHSQPSLPNHREASFDQVQLVPRAHTATPTSAVHGKMANMGSMEMALRH